MSASPRGAGQPAPPTAVLLSNIGSPSAPETAAVRAYLSEFLADPMVVDAPRLQWWLVRNLIILPFRSPRSARLYRSIWTQAGSPLIETTRRQASALAAELASRLGAQVPVTPGMRYGRPSLAAAVRGLADAGCRRLVVLPLYPQYSRTTVGTTVAALAGLLEGSSVPIEWQAVEGYPTHPAYLRALASSIREGRAPDRRAHLVMSFHGLPQRYADAGDPYPDHCHRTATGLARELGLEPGQWTLAYQSRFGREPWLRPDTVEVLTELAAGGAEAVDVVCPGFAADCLETLEEIAVRARDRYRDAGGSRFRFVPALNDRPDHIAALADLVEGRLARWDAPQGDPRHP